MKAGDDLLFKFGDQNGCFPWEIPANEQEVLPKRDTQMDPAMVAKQGNPKDTRVLTMTCTFWRIALQGSQSWHLLGCCSLDVGSLACLYLLWEIMWFTGSLGNYYAASNCWQLAIAKTGFQHADLQLAG